MTPPADRPRVLVLSLGGTIAMAQNAAGQRAVPAGASSLPPSAQPAGVDVEHRAITDVPSPSLRTGHLAAVLHTARAAVEAGAAGVVVTHGTDTLEESALLLDLCWDRPEPLVLTGAMRPANAPGADGPANLRDAVRTAVAPSARSLGVLVVVDGHAHLAEQVSKVSSRSVAAFASEPAGPVAIVGEEDLRLLHQPLTRPAPVLRELSETLPRVPVIALGQGDDGALLDALTPRLDGPATDRADSARADADGPTAVDGLVVAGVGMGHVPEHAVPRLRRLVAAGIPVVVSTRVTAGGTSTDHYAYPGSEVDLIRAGCVMSGLLRPSAARVLLQALLADGADAARIAERFSRHAS